MREFRFLETIEKKFSKKGAGLVLGIGDDCAHLSPIPSGVQLISTDQLVHGVHFSERFISWEDIGYRSIAVSLSDLAASGADPSRPIFVFLAVSVPLGLRKEKLEDFFDGVAQCIEKQGAILAGGDLTTTDGPITITVTVVGSTDTPVSRAGAQNGDLLAICGFVGKAATGLDLLDTGRQVDERDSLIAAYARPKPLITVGHALASAGIAKAMIDVSDGVLADAEHLGERSSVDVWVHVDKLPVPSAVIKAQGEQKAYKAGATFGDDYALLVALDEQNLSNAAKIVVDCGSTLEVIGRFETGTGVLRATFKGEPYSFAQKGYQHKLGR